MTLLNRWLIRLAFSFLILAGLLAWETHKQVTTDGWTPKTMVMACGAALALGIGLRGIRERHRSLIDRSENDLGR
jgi:hypothetical protein